MKEISLIVLISLALAACGTTTGDRGLSGAGIGAGIGLLAGPPGVVAGGVIGAGVGALTKPRNVYLGEPVWND